MTLTIQHVIMSTFAGSFVLKFDGSIMSLISDPDVNLKVSIPKSVDRALEEEAFKRDAMKKTLVEKALRAFLKLPAKERAA